MAVHQCLPSNLTELERICKEEWQRIPKSRCEKLSGNQGYDSNQSVPFRAFTRHHGEFLRYGNAIQSRHERGYGQPVPVTQRGRIPINNRARRVGSQLIGGDKPMSAYTSGILNLHIWQVTIWAALRAGQNWIDCSLGVRTL